MQAEHWSAVKTIYSEGIATGNATFQTHISNWKTWDRCHLPVCRWVAKKDNTVLGWAMLSPVSSQCVYAGVAEVSIYVTQRAQGCRVGTSLLNRVIDDAEANKLWMLEAHIFPENTASLRLHKRCGFREVGLREKLGQLNGQWRDVLLLERRSPVIPV